MSTNSSSRILSSALFYRLAAFCCAYYVAAQVLQAIVFHLGANDSAAGEKEILQRLTSLDQFRAAILLLGFSLIPILTAYAGVALRRYALSPVTAGLCILCSIGGLGGGGEIY